MSRWREVRAAWAAMVLSSCLTKPNPEYGDSAATSTSGDAGSTVGSGAAGVSTAGSNSASDDVPVAWWHPDWAYRRELVLATDSPTVTLDAFPILVRLPPDVLGESAIAPGGDDLRFVDTTNADLAYEIERFGAEAILWVRIPTIEAGRPEHSIYMYYGNPGAAPVADAGAVWDERYAAVYHLSDEADATARVGDGQTVDAGFGPGLVADGLLLDGVEDSHMMLPAADGLQDLFAVGGTIATLVRLVDFGESEQGRIVDKAVNASGTEGWILNVDGTMAPGEPNRTVRFMRSHDDDGMYPVARLVWKAESDSIVPATWHFVVLTHDERDSETAIYIDGEDRGTVITQTATTPVEPEASIGPRVGRGGGTIRYFHGVIDELRFARVVRDPAWIALQNRSVRDELVTIGPEERP